MARDLDLRGKVTMDGADKAADQLDDIAEAAEQVEKPIDLRVTTNLDKALDQLDQLNEQARADAVAMEALASAMGPELAGRADMGAVIDELKRLGLTAEEVTANATELAVKLQDVDSPDLGGNLGKALGTARGEAEKLTDSARGANSALANMVGNSAQDVANLGGIAGSTGVALGQMAEYAADAVLESESLGGALSSMVKVAGPVAALSAGIALVSAILGEVGRRSQEAAERTDQLGEAMANSGDDALGFAQVLRDNSDALSDFIADANDPLGGFGVSVDEIASKVPLIGGLFKEAGVDIYAALNAAGQSLYSFGTAIDKGGAAAEQFRTKLQQARDAGKITGEQYNALREVFDNYAGSAEDAAKMSKALAVSGDEVAAMLSDIAGQEQPLARLPDIWGQLFEEMRNGTADSQRAADAVNRLSESLGLTPTEVLKLARDHMADLEEQTKEAAKAAQEAGEEYAKAMSEAAIATAQAQSAVEDLTSAFSQIGIRQGALQSIFDLGNAPLDALGAMQDVEQGIRDLAESVKGHPIPNIFDPNDVNADDFLSKIASLRGPIQEQVSSTFGAAGPEAAQQLADSYVDQIVASLGGALTRDQVLALLNLGDLEAKIGVALDQSALATAQRSLEILVGLKGETPYTASIALALQTGDITPQAAQAAINQQLAGAGVEIPSTLQTPDAGQATVAAAQFAAEHPVEFPSTLDPSGAQSDVKGFADSRQPTATVPVDANLRAAEQGIASTKTTATNTVPIVNVKASTDSAIVTMLALNLIAAAMAPRVPVTAYLYDYPTAAEIANRIGVVRVPVDAYLRSQPRITGAG